MREAERGFGDTDRHLQERINQYKTLTNLFFTLSMLWAAIHSMVCFAFVDSCRTKRSASKRPPTKTYVHLNVLGSVNLGGNGANLVLDRVAERVELLQLGSLCSLRHSQHSPGKALRSAAARVPAVEGHAVSCSGLKTTQDLRIKKKKKKKISVHSPSCKAFQ